MSVTKHNKPTNSSYLNLEVSIIRKKQSGQLLVKTQSLLIFGKQFCTDVLLFTTSITKGG